MKTSRVGLGQPLQGGLTIRIDLNTGKPRHEKCTHTRNGRQWLEEGTGHRHVQRLALFLSPRGVGAGLALRARSVSRLSGTVP